MADYQVIVNDRTGRARRLTLDPSRPLEPQLRQQLGLKDDVVIAYRPPEGGEYRGLGPAATLSALRVEPGGALHLRLPERPGPAPWMIAAAVAALALVALIVGFTQLGRAPVAPTVPAATAAVVGGDGPGATAPPEAPAEAPTPPTEAPAPTDATGALAPPPTEAPATTEAPTAPPPAPDPTPTFTITVALPGLPVWQERRIGMRIAGDLAEDHLKPGGRLSYLFSDRETGQPLDYRLVVDFVTDGPTVTDTRRLAEGLVQSGATHCVVGHFASDDTRVAADVYGGAGILTLTPASTRADVIGPARPTLWRLVSTDRYQAPEAYELAGRTGAEGKILVVRPAGEFAAGVNDEFRLAAERAGQAASVITPTLVYEREGPMAEYLAPAVASAKGGEPFGLLFFIGTAEELRAFLEAYQGFPQGTPIVGVSSLDDINVVGSLRRAGYAVSYTGLAVPVQQPQNMTGPLMAPWFVEDYTTKGGPPAANAAETYDGVAICAEAIRKAAGDALAADAAFDLGRLEPAAIAQGMVDLVGESELFGQASVRDEPGTAAGRYIYGEGSRELSNSILILHEPAEGGGDLTTRLSCAEDPEPGCR